MGKAYSDDLRRKVLERHQEGEDTLEELAEQFRVSVGWVYKISAAFTRTGKMERQLPARVGRKKKATTEIEQWVHELPEHWEYLDHVGTERLYSLEEGLHYGELPAAGGEG